MTTAVLEKPTEALAKELYPVTEPVAGSSAVAGGIQGSSIIVIENPRVRNLTAFLLSFSKIDAGKEIALIKVQHHVVNQNNGQEDFREYEAARVKKRVIVYLGKPLSEYNYVQAGNAVLLMPSIRKYEIRFIKLEDYFTARDLLGKSETFKDGLSTVYRLVAERSDVFRLENGRLSMPDDYASLKIQRLQVL